MSPGIVRRRAALLNILEGDCCGEAVEGAVIPLMAEENMSCVTTRTHAELLLPVMLSGGRAVACDRTFVVEVPLPSSHSFIDGYHSRLRSSHCGFIDSINAIFFSRRQPFSCFSRPIAL